MKNLYILAALCAFGLADAQVPNNGFEETISDGFTLKNWGYFFPISITIDPETGENTGDQIVFQNGTGFSSPVGNCVTGSWSMMLTNALNVTQNTVIPGKASLFNDADSETATGWNNGFPIAPGTVVDRLGFDYQFFPAGDNDAAEATLELFGAGGESVGKATINISGFSADFAYVYMPLQLTSTEIPVFMTIDFDMAPEGSTPTFGSMLLIDNVKVNGLALGNNATAKNLFTVYPTVVEHSINLIGNGEITGNISVTIADAAGKTIGNQLVRLNGDAASINVDGLASGMYLLTAESSAGKSVTRFIKK